MFSFSHLFEHVGINSYDIICLSETWLMDQPRSIPYTLQDYNHVWSHGTREADTGRASGGLAIFVNKNIIYECVSVTNCWIFIKIYTRKGSILIGNIHFRPQNLDIHMQLKSLQRILDEEDLSDDLDFVYLGGDFNSKLGNTCLNCMPEEMFELSALECECELSHNGHNRRGEILSEFMAKNGFILVNGRSVSDKPAKITFVKHTGVSIIDLMWAKCTSLAPITDLKVNKSVVTGSDHFPVILSLWQAPVKVNKWHSQTRLNKRDKPKLKWNPNDCDQILNYYSEMCKVYPIDLDYKALSASELYDNFIDAVRSSAEASGMCLRSGPLYPRTNKPVLNLCTKPWFDKNCSEKRKTYIQLVDRCFASGFADDDRLAYLQFKKEYKKFLNFKKKTIL